MSGAIKLRAGGGAGQRAIMTEDMAAMGRVNRYPQHTFNIRMIPFAITPFMVAPVLPGESLKNLLMQVRAVTDPITNPLIGWWYENYFFYVKHRDIEGNMSASAQTMMLDPSFAWTTGNGGRNSAAQDWYINASATYVKPDWLRLAYERIVNEFFRDEGEAAFAYGLGAYASAKFMGMGWLDSAVTATFDDAIDVPLDRDANGTITAEEASDQMQLWQFQRMNRLTEMSYEDWLATYGVRQPTVEINRPELIRYSRSWQYPSNTINPSTGVPSSAVSWSIRERADKRRFFKEPGFIIGLSLVRPKVYFANVREAAVYSLDTWRDWLPATMTNDRNVSIQTLPAAHGLLGGQTGNYVMDTRDLFLYGDQFINYDLGAVGTPTANVNLLAYPKDGVSKKYPNARADLNGLFTGTTDAARMIRADGVVNLTIAGRQIDQT